VLFRSDIGLGTDMHAVGDANGDGFTDYVVTAPGEAGPITSVAKTNVAYLVFGGPTGPQANAVSLDSMVKNGQAVALVSTNSGEALGGGTATQSSIINTGAVTAAQTAMAQYAQYHSVASLGNIDGSGSNYFAVGSPGVIGTYNNCGISEGAGAVYVFDDLSKWSSTSLPTWNSKTQSWGSLTSLTNAGGFVIYSSSFAAFATGTAGTKYAPSGVSDLGFAISSAGDVNGDGVTDFLIGAPTAYMGQGAVFLLFGSTGGLIGQRSGVVDLDKITVNMAGSLTYGQAFGTAGTAWQYTGSSAAGDSYKVSSYLGTDVTGGDFNGSGISGYSLSEWNAANSANGSGSAAYSAGKAYIYNGTTAYLTQSYYNEDGHVYYAGFQGADSATIKNGVDLIATGTGNNDWVHGIGTDTTGTTATHIQHDAVNGGAGNDYVGIIGTNFTSVSGGTGWNTLVFESSDLTLNLTQMGLRVDGFAAFDLNNQLNNDQTDPSGKFTDQAFGNRLQLSLADVLTEADGTVGVSTQHMTVLGDASSAVELSDKGWSVNGVQTINGITFDNWHNATMGSSKYADLLIEKGVHVTTPTSGNLVGVDYLYGTDGADTLSGGPSGADVLVGYGGNDLLMVGSSNFVYAGGGSGFDTLQLTGGGLTLANLNNVKGIEQINLGSSGNTVNVSLQDVLHMPDATPRTLTVNGGASDTVKLSATDGFTHAAGDIQFQNGATYDVWHATSGTDVATLLLQQSLHVQQV
jgi:hypothetical protein